MSDNVTPPSGPPAGLATTVALVTAIALLEEQTRGGHPAPAPRVEPRQVPRRPGKPTRDPKGRFRRRV